MAETGPKLPPQPDFSQDSEKIHEEMAYSAPDPEAGPSLKEPKKEEPAPEQSKKQFSKQAKDSDEIDILKYLSIVLRRKKIVFITLLGIVFLNLVKDFGRTDIYKAETKLLVQVRKPNPIGEVEYSYFWDQQTRINTMLNTIKSREIMKRVIDSLNLDQGANALANSITAARLQETNIILISATSFDPEKSAGIANCVAKEFIAFNNEITRKDITDAINYISRQITTTETELRLKEDALKVFQQENRLIEQMPAADTDVEKLSNLEVALQNTLVEIVENDEKINQLTKLLKREKMYVEQSFTFDNTVEGQLIQLNVELARALAEYGERHRQVWQLKENIKKLTELAKLNSEGKNKISSTKSLNENRQKLLQEFNDRVVEANALRAKRNAYESVLKELNASLKAIPEKYLTLRRLQRDKETIEKIYELLQSKYQEQRIRYEMQSSDVVQWEEASVPKSPVPQGSKFGFLVVILVGLIAGVGVALAVEFLDQTVKSPQEIEDELNLPLLGIIPLISDEDKVLTLDTKSKILEPYRSLRTNIRYTNLGAAKRSILITSAIQGDGKTTKACNLAISFALDGKKVMIVDADLRRSNVHKLFNVEKEPGLSEYLTRQAGYRDIIKPAFNGQISVVPAGKRPPNPAEILGNPHLLDLIQAGLQDHDIVLIDSPALVPVSDALLVAPYVDSTIVVGRALKTPLKAIHFTKNSLDRVNANIIGVIFNGVEQKKGYYPYYYNYYSYYHYYKSRYYQYYDEDDEMAKLPKNFKEFILFAGKELLSEGLKAFKSMRPFADKARHGAGRNKKALIALVVLLFLALAGMTSYRILVNKKSPEKGGPERYVYIPVSPPHAGAFQADDERKAVIERIRSWQVAVKEGNFNLYRTFYSRENFKSRNGGFAEWMEQQEKVFDRLKERNMRMETLRFVTAEKGYRVADIEFEVPEGLLFTEKVARTLRVVFALEGGQWKIVGEGARP